MASYDAGKLTNQSKRSSKIYKDLNLDFQQNTATKDIQKSGIIEPVLEEKPGWLDSDAADDLPF